MTEYTYVYMKEKCFNKYTSIIFLYIFSYCITFISITFLVDNPEWRARIYEKIPLFLQKNCPKNY